MKEDTPAPNEIPTKRRALRDAPAFWLAVWASRPNLTDVERERVEAERARRKRALPIVALGVLVGPEGMTPQQRAALDDYRANVNATEIVDDGDMASIVKVSTVVFAAPRAANATGTAVWAGVRYARHRKVPVRIVLPNGAEG